MIELKRSGDHSEQETRVLFYIDDKEYRVPAKPRVNLALQYLTDVRTQGAFLAELSLLERLLGEDGYQALCNFDDLTPEQFSQVQDEAVQIALGALEKSQGNGGKRGSRKSRG